MLVAELNHIIFPPGSSGEGRWVVILGAYFDESGTNKNDPALVLAGLVAPADAWVSFSKEWERLMHEWEVPYFHMNKFERRQGVYGTWNEDTRRERLNTLLDLICGTAVGALGVGVEMGRFRQVFGSEISANVRFAIAAKAIFQQISKLDREGNALAFYSTDADRFAFVFEAGAKGIGRIQKTFRRFYNNPIQRMIFRLATFTLGGRVDYPPLQAADILAYELHRSWARQYELELPARYPLQRLSTLAHNYGNISVVDMEVWKPDILESLKRGLI